MPKTQNATDFPLRLFSISQENDIAIPRRSVHLAAFRAPFAPAFGVNGQSSQIGPEGSAPLPHRDQVMLICDRAYRVIKDCVKISLQQRKKDRRARIR